MNQTHSSMRPSTLSGQSVIPQHLPGVHSHAKPNKDIEFGFDMFKLSKKEAARVAKLLISDASKNIGTRSK
jgi:hypothetical protein